MNAPYTFLLSSPNNNLIVLKSKEYVSSSHFILIFIGLGQGHGLSTRAHIPREDEKSNRPWERGCLQGAKPSFIRPGMKHDSAWVSCYPIYIGGTRKVLETF